MTLFDIRADKDAASATISWTKPDTNLWVATVDGEYAGMVDFVAGHFEVSDHQGGIIGVHTSIPEAQAALAAHANAQTLPAAVRLLNAFKSASGPSPLLDRRPRPAYQRGKVA